MIVDVEDFTPTYPYLDVEEFGVVKSPTLLSYEDQIVVMGCGGIRTEGPGFKGP